jgi:branched-chain amino acid transport system ATP-binding protein
VSLLEAHGIYGGYGGGDVLNGVDLAVDDGQIAVMVGPNGAGKSTVMKAIFGLVRVRSGMVRFAGEDITNARPDQLVQRGMSYVPQERNVFPSLTVQENLDMGAYVRDDDCSAELEQVFEIFPRSSLCSSSAAGSRPGRCPAASARWWR